MMTKCRDIESRINQLENQINNISPSKKLFTITNEKEISPPQESLTSSQTQFDRINILEDQNDKESFRSAVVGSESNMSSFYYRRNPSQVSAKLSSKDSHHFFNSNEPVAELNFEMEYSSNKIKTEAEKESDALKPKEENESIPIISIKNPPLMHTKQFCECMLSNPLNINKKPSQWRNDLSNETSFGCTTMNFESSAPSSVLSDKKNMNVPQGMDNFLIDSLRGEIEKVRHKLFEIGNRPYDSLQDFDRKTSKEKLYIEASAGDNKNQNFLEELRDLQNKNDEISQQLEEHKKLQESSMKKARDATQLLNAYEVKVNALHEQALKSSKMMAHGKEKFCNILRSRNSQIKNLYELNQQLRKSMEVNGEQMNKLKNNYKILRTRYKEIQEKDRTTREENFKLKEVMKNLEKELKVVHKECFKLQGENVKFLSELNLLKENVANEYTTKLGKHNEHLENLMKKSRQNETRLIKEVKDISQKLHVQGNELEDMKSEVKSETSDLHKKYKKLLAEYEALVKKFQEYEQFDEIKCSCIEQELKEFSMKMKEKEGIILRERDDLRGLVEEMARAIRHNKTTIFQLNQINDQHERVINNLKDIIKTKDEKIAKYEAELEELRKQRDESMKEIATMNTTFQNTERNFDFDPEKIIKELTEARDSFMQEKDNNLIKQKIIEDHEETISNLKEQNDDKAKEIEQTIQCLRKATDEADRLSEHLKFMEVEISKEKEEKQNLQKELDDINVHKESLSKQVSDLEYIVKSHYIEGNMYQTDHKNIIEKLGQQMKKQKKEWEMQKKILQRDKEKALNAARFASQKLLDTVNDFQKRMCQQKAAQNKLALLLQGKEQQLESLTTKVKSLITQNQPCNLRPDNSQNTNNICAGFCQIKQIYPESNQLYHSIESINEQGSKSFCMMESNSSSVCYSDM